MVFETILDCRFWISDWGSAGDRLRQGYGGLAAGRSSALQICNSTKRTHRKGILRGKMMNFGTEFGAIFGCGIMRARGWVGLWGDLRSIVVRGRETRAQPEKSGHDGAWPSTKPGTTKIKDWRLGTRRLPGLTLRRGDGIQCQAWVHLTS